MNEDREIFQHIDTLVDEEHRLRNRHLAGEGLSDAERGRLRELEESLDQCWDLLRQRRAARDAGAEPGSVRARPVEEVERYLQ